MKKFIPLLAICLAILCLFSSCGELWNNSIQGTWEYEYREAATNYVCYRVVVSEDKIQISKNTYGLSGHRLPKSSDVSELMPYTVGENGVLTLSYRDKAATRKAEIEFDNITFARLAVRL